MAVSVVMGMQRNGVMAFSSAGILPRPARCARSVSCGRMTHDGRLSCAGNNRRTPLPMTTDQPHYETSATGLRHHDEVVGTGAAPVTGQNVSVHYTGWLDDAGSKGRKFDSSLDRGKPFSFRIGQGMVIAGWDEGVATMKVGGKRTLVIPADLGYGARGAGGAIPPNATLIFDVELLGVG